MDEMEAQLCAMDLAPSSSAREHMVAVASAWYADACACVA